ncbi:hypothetical protein RR11_1504 [Ruegeria sp. R11]|nr:hypothetical protein RR11_1504 [Ruegeria sp. R11]
MFPVQPLSFAPSVPDSERRTKEVLADENAPHRSPCRFGKSY